MDSSQPNEKNWPYAVAYRIIVEKNGQRKETDHLEYCGDMNHATAIAHQAMASGYKDVAIVDLNQKVE
jgi:hypothetical protein